MKARVMIHSGKAKMTVPAEVSRYFDTDLMDYVTQVRTPEREIEYDVQPGTKFGGYPVRTKVTVPPSRQKALYDKGFRFDKEADEKAFLAERVKIEAEIKRRERVAKVEERKAEAAKPKNEEKAEEVAPASDLIFGEKIDIAAAVATNSEVPKAALPVEVKSEGGK